MIVSISADLKKRFRIVCIKQNVTMTEVLTKFIEAYSDDPESLEQTFQLK